MTQTSNNFFVPSLIITKQTLEGRKKEVNKQTDTNSVKNERNAFRFKVKETTKMDQNTMNDACKNL